MCVHAPHRCRVVLVPSGADHPAQHLHAVRGDVSRCVDGFLGHRLAVDQRSGACLADGDVQLKKAQNTMSSLNKLKS